MAESCKASLERWTAAGASRRRAGGSHILAYEAQRGAKPGLGTPVRLAIAFGGVLLFVEAPRDEHSPAARLAVLPGRAHPDLPLRGRYVQLCVETPLSEADAAASSTRSVIRVALRIETDRLAASRFEAPTGAAARARPAAPIHARGAWDPSRTSLPSTSPTPRCPLG